MQSEDQNSLYRVVKDYIPAKKIARYNKLKKWDYGYNKDYDVVVISKNGTIGEVICIGTDVSSANSKVMTSLNCIFSPFLLFVRSPM